MLRISNKVIILIFSSVLCLDLFSSVYYVSDKGSNDNPGTLEKPFKTLEHASNLLEPGDTCYIREGIYREVIKLKNSGLKGKEIKIENYKNEKVYITGTDIISNWSKGEKNIYKASMGWNLKDGNQLFIDNEMMYEASWPEPGSEPFFNPGSAIASDGGSGFIVNKDIPGTSNDWVGADLWCAGGLAWVGWSAKVTGFDEGTGKISFKSGNWYTESFWKPKKGNRFLLRGTKMALDRPGEWIYEPKGSQLLIIPPKGVNPNSITIEAKRRFDVIDLSGKSYIKIKGLEFYGGGIRTDKNSTNLTFENLKGKYVSHSYYGEVAKESGVLINGENHLILNCDFGYSSGFVIKVKGKDHKFINNYIHHGNYAGWLDGVVALSGRRILFSHNTVQHSGRDIITTYDLMESLVQYNDIGYSGWLTKDLGMMYGHNTDYANTVFKRNWVHDNVSKSEPELAMGIYFDHGNQNAIVMENLVWNVPGAPINFNNPAYNNLVYNNSCFKTGEISTFDYLNRDDMFNSRFEGNIFNKQSKLPGSVLFEHNKILSVPTYKDVEEGDFRLEEPLKAGAYANNNEFWEAGCDFINPPNPLPVFKEANIPWMNGVYNAGFEFGSIEGWDTLGSGDVSIIKGNNWGSNFGILDDPKKLHDTATQHYELKLGRGKNGVKQTVKNLNPNTKYALSAWVRSSGSKEKVTLGVKGSKTTKSKSSSSKKWKRLTVKFTTGENEKEVTIYIEKSEGKGEAWCDNFSLPLNPGSF